MRLQTIVSSRTYKSTDLSVALLAVYIGLGSTKPASAVQESHGKATLTVENRAAAAQSAAGDATIPESPVVGTSKMAAPVPSSPADVVRPALSLPLTIDQVVAAALDNNTTIQLARLRLDKAQQSVYQTDAAGYPQVQLSAGDTLSSQPQYGSSFGGSSQSVSLPGGGAIPIVTDQGGNTTGTFGSNVSSGGSAATSPSVTSGAINGGNSAVSAPNQAPINGTSPTGAAPTTNAPSANALPDIVRTFNTTVNAMKAKTTVPDVPLASTGTGTNQNVFAGGQHNNYGARLTFTQGIDLFHLVPTARKVESATRDFYAIDLERVSNELALSTKITFYSVLRAEQLLIAQQEQVTAAEESLRIAQARFNAGVAAQFDVVTAQTTLSNAQQLQSSAQNELDLARANLNNIMGRNLDAPVNLVTPNITTSGPKPDVSAEVAVATSQRPEIEQAVNNLTIANKLITLASAGMKPSVSLVGSADYAGLTRSGIPSTTYSLTAQLGLPLYDGGATNARVKSARIDLKTQQVDLAQLKQNISLEVRTAVLNVDDAKNRISTTQQGVTQALEALRLANLRYKNEAGTFLEVSNAEAQLATARNNLATAQYDLGTSTAQLTRATGGR